jgi:hypothetical protein
MLRDSQIRIRWGMLIAAALALSQAGCLLIAAGAAGGAAIGYAYCKGKVCQAYNANFADSLAAVHSALAELGLPLASEQIQGITGQIQSAAANGDKIAIELDLLNSSVPAEGQVTRICVRVGVFGDYTLSERILNQVDAHLVPSRMNPGAILGSAPLSPIQPAAATVPPNPPQSSEPPLSALPPSR